MFSYRQLSAPSAFAHLLAPQPGERVISVRGDGLEPFRGDYEKYARHLNTIIGSAQKSLSDSVSIRVGQEAIVFTRRLRSSNVPVWTFAEADTERVAYLLHCEIFDPAQVAALDETQKLLGLLGEPALDREFEWLLAAGEESISVFVVCHNQSAQWAVSNADLPKLKKLLASRLTMAVSPQCPGKTATALFALNQNIQTLNPSDSVVAEREALIKALPGSTRDLARRLNDWLGDPDAAWEAERTLGFDQIHVTFTLKQIPGAYRRIWTFDPVDIDKIALLLQLEQVGMVDTVLGEDSRVFSDLLDRLRKPGTTTVTQKISNKIITFQMKVIDRELLWTYPQRYEHLLAAHLADIKALPGLYAPPPQGSSPLSLKDNARLRAAGVSLAALQKLTQRLQRLRQDQNIHADYEFQVTRIRFEARVTGDWQWFFMETDIPIVCDLLRALQNEIDLQNLPALNPGSDMALSMHDITFRRMIERDESRLQALLARLGLPADAAPRAAGIPIARVPRQILGSGPQALEYTLKQSQDPVWTVPQALRALAEFQARLLPIKPEEVALGASHTELTLGTDASGIENLLAYLDAPATALLPHIQFGPESAALTLCRRWQDTNIVLTCNAAELSRLGELLKAVQPYEIRITSHDERFGQIPGDAERHASRLNALLGDPELVAGQVRLIEIEGQTLRFQSKKFRNVSLWTFHEQDLARVQTFLGAEGTLERLQPLPDTHVALTDESLKSDHGFLWSDVETLKEALGDPKLQAQIELVLKDLDVSVTFLKGLNHNRKAWGLPITQLAQARKLAVLLELQKLTEFADDVQILRAPNGNIVVCLEDEEQGPRLVLRSDRTYADRGLLAILRNRPGVARWLTYFMGRFISS